MDKLMPREEKEIAVLRLLVGTYCRARHAPSGGALCAGCAELLAYAELRRRGCPLDPRPACKGCPIHCYDREHRALIREVMAYSGWRLLLRGRVDLLWHYFF